jgi:hypothetical protein
VSEGIHVSTLKSDLSPDGSFVRALLSLFSRAFVTIFPRFCHFFPALLSLFSRAFVAGLQRSSLQGVVALLHG